MYVCIPRAVVWDLYAKVPICIVYWFTILFSPLSLPFETFFTVLTCSNNDNVRYIQLLPVIIFSRSLSLFISWCTLSSAFSICFCNRLGVSDITTKSSANINPYTVSSPIVTPWFVVSTATLQRHQCIPWIYWVTVYIPVQLLVRYQHIFMYLSVQHSWTSRGGRRRGGLDEGRPCKRVGATAYDMPTSPRLLYL